MAAVVMDGKALAAKVKEEVARRVAGMEDKPGLAVVLVGEDPASRVYVGGRRKDCEQCGIYSEEYVLPQDTRQEELLELIQALNARRDIDGILVQFPLPGHLDEKGVQLAIAPDKDVDCVHPVNIGYVMLGERAFRPCTPAGVMRLLGEYGIDPAGKRCVVVGRSNIVGKPMAMLLLAAHGTVTICHSRTKDLGEVCRRADILIVAAGVPGLVKPDWIKPGATVIDVGVNRVGFNEKTGKPILSGDVDFAEASKVAGKITPVPGGVGPMTIAMLMKNTVRSAWHHLGR